MFFLGLITRCKDEFFIKEFCDYYLSQEVDKIFIIDDNSDDKLIYNNINDNRVEIIYEKNLFSTKGQMDIVNKYYDTLKQNFKWIISVDVDEFIITKKNINKTLKDELNTTFKYVDCVKIPWVMIACNNKDKNPKSILLENIYRWNHDKKHPNKIHKFRCRYDKIEVKCIFKTNKFNKIDVHHPIEPVGDNIIVDSIIKKEQKLKSYHNNLREEDIKNGYLLCYHYRIISKENCQNKLKKYQYLKFKLEDLLETDYPEIIDETLKIKTMNNNLK